MKNIVVVGGTKGIGKEVVLRLKDNKVFVIARTDNYFVDTEKLHFIQGDVTGVSIDLSSLPEAIHGFVYCPGTINLKPFHRLTETDFLNDWQVNFMGAVKLLQWVLPKLKSAENSSVVLFSSVAATVGIPFHASISSAKAAIEGLTKSLAAELAPGIRVNCIAPSLTQTGLAERLLNTLEKTEAAGKRHPLQRIGQPADIAGMVYLLLSDQSAWITGQVLHVDGGMSTLKL